MKIMPYLKAIYGAIMAALGATSTAYVQGHGHIGWEAGIVIATSALTALGVIWGVPNIPNPIVINKAATEGRGTRDV